MSAKLERALAKKQVLVRKKTSGEVVVHFKSKEVKDVVLSSRGTLDLLSRRGVTSEAIRNSNLKLLIQQGLVEVL